MHQRCGFQQRTKKSENFTINNRLVLDNLGSYARDKVKKNNLRILSIHQLKRFANKPNESIRNQTTP